MSATGVIPHKLYDVFKQLDLLDLLHVTSEYNRIEQIMGLSP